MPDSQLTQPYTKTTTTFDTPLFDQLIEQLSCVSRWSTPGSLAAARGELAERNVRVAVLEASLADTEEAHAAVAAEHDALAAQVNAARRQLAAVEQLTQTLEWETRQAEVVGALRAGNRALDAFHAEISPEAVAELMNETEEALAVEQEISRLIAGGGALADYGDAEALRELQALTESALALHVRRADMPFLREL